MTPGWLLCAQLRGGLDALNPVLRDKNSAGPIAVGRELQLGFMPIQYHSVFLLLSRTAEAVILTHSG